MIDKLWKISVLILLSFCAFLQYETLRSVRNNSSVYIEDGNGSRPIAVEVVNPPDKPIPTAPE